jgi:hypothetical protein
VSEPGRRLGAGPSAVRISLGGLCFNLRTDGSPLLPETDESYRQFVLDPAAEDDGETVDVQVSIARVQPPRGRLLFDGGSWGVFAQGDERSLVVQPPTMSEPLCAARFRPGSREVGLICAPRFLESNNGAAGIPSQFRYPLDQVLSMYLLGGRGLILHAAGFDVRGRGVALPGASGAGKSTITRLADGWEGVRPLSDDRVILRKLGDGVVLHGTPWPGEAGVAENLAAPAGWLLFLVKGNRNSVRTIAPREALARLLPTASLPWYDAEHLESGLRACDGIVRSVPAGVFTFREEPGAVEMLEAFLADHQH